MLLEKLFKTEIVQKLVTRALLPFLDIGGTTSSSHMEMKLIFNKLRLDMCFRAAFDEVTRDFVQTTDVNGQRLRIARVTF
jgi:hypothetical protein